MGRRSPFLTYVSRVRSRSNRVQYQYPGATTLPPQEPKKWKGVYLYVGCTVHTAGNTRAEHFLHTQGGHSSRYEHKMIERLGGDIGHDL